MDKIYQGFTIVELAEQALQKPADFGWWGDEEMFVTWGWAGVDKTRDSGYLVLSNFDVITRDLMERFPDEFRTVGLGHWAHGHADRLTVHILKNENLGCVEENITDAFKAAMEWLSWLEEYPVADDSHYSDLCYSEFVAAIRSNIPDMVRYVDDSLDETAAEIASELLQNEHIYGYIDIMDEYSIGVTSEDLMKAAFRLKLIDEDYAMEWDDYCDTMGWPSIDWENRSTWCPEVPGQMTIFEVQQEAEST